MKKILFGTCLAALVTFSACSSKQPDQDPSIMPAGDRSVVNTSAITDTIQPAVTIPSGAVPNKANATQPASAVPVPAVATAKPIATGVGLNPAHGQPGHRCDIAVGAPLNSPAQTIKTPTTATPSASVAPVKSTSTAGGGRLNPPHGQPGHDCKIAVGQPLP